MVYPLALGIGGPDDILMILLLILIPSVFWIVELIDVARRQFPQPNVKVLWVIVVLLGHFLGALIYKLAGQQQGTIPV